MKDLRFYLQGKKAELFVYEDRVLIIKKSDNTKGESSYKNILICDIEKVEVLPSGQNLGSIEFYVNEDIMLRKIKNDNIVQFKSTKVKQENLNAFAIKSYIEEEIRKNDINRKAMAKLIADGIMAFKELLDCGAITQDEFEKKKKEILGL